MKVVVSSALLLWLCFVGFMAIDTIPDVSNAWGVILFIVFTAALGGAVGYLWREES